MASPRGNRIPSPTPSQLPPVPSSPVYSLASTTMNPAGLSSFSLPLPPQPRPAHAVLTTADLERSQEAYSQLLSSAKGFRLALAELSTAASVFGSALEACARLKEARAEPVEDLGMGGLSASYAAKPSCTADTLMSASGVQHLVANHQQILSETVYRSFEVPLLHDLDKWQSVIDGERETYEAGMRAQSREIKRLEKDGLKLHKQRKRDLGRFRAHLVDLTNKLDGLTTLHADHSRTLLRESQDTSKKIVEVSCSIVRAEVDIFESLARKGWSGGGLDDLLERGQDLFATEDIQEVPSKLFSILPPKSILADEGTGGGVTASSVLGDAANITTSLRGESGVTGATGQYARSDSLMDAAVGSVGDTESIMSERFSRPRNARPFSPQPIRRRPTDVTIESLVGATALTELAMPVSVQSGITEEEDDIEPRQETREETGALEVERGVTPEPERGRSPEFITDDESSPASIRSS